MKVKLGARKAVGLYFIILICVQAIGLLHFLIEPGFRKGIILAILLGTILPIILGLAFMRFIQIV
ncbi:MAG TPA: hypothetical protein ENG18_00095 [Nitrososphaeria archaeon]|nr:hypothetical protein [Nitrososphaeria archaeon]